MPELFVTNLQPVNPDDGGTSIVFDGDEGKQFTLTIDAQDTIHVTITSVSLNKNSTPLTAGGAEILTATVDTTGKLTAVGAGTATITVTLDEGYELERLTVLDSRDSEITLTDRGEAARAQVAAMLMRFACCHRRRGKNYLSSVDSLGAVHTAFLRGICPNKVSDYVKTPPSWIWTQSDSL